MRQEQWTLEPENTSPGQARRLIDGFGSECGFHGEALETAMLLTSELVTNAVVHARTVITLAALANDVLRVIVKDDNPRLPQAAMVSADSASGRGLALVQTLSSSWGVDSDDTGKRVWFEVLPEVTRS